MKLTLMGGLALAGLVCVVVLVVIALNTPKSKNPDQDDLPLES